MEECNSLDELEGTEFVTAERRCKETKGKISL